MLPVLIILMTILMTLLKMRFDTLGEILEENLDEDNQIAHNPSPTVPEFPWILPITTSSATSGYLILKRKTKSKTKGYDTKNGHRPVYPRFQ